MRTNWLSIWLTLAFLAAFVLAAVYTPETADSRAHHRGVSAAWQKVQDDKAKNDPKGDSKPGYRAAWRDTAWANAIQSWDHTTFKRINEGCDNRFFDAVMPGITKLGDGAVQALALIVLWFWARRRKRVDWMRTAVLSVAGILLSAVAPQIKLLLPRYRPPALLPYDIVLLVHPLYGGSFPSGHTMSSFAIATVISLHHRWAAAPAFALAAIIGLSRISVGVHWPLDVLGGAVIGVGLGLMVVKWDNRKGKETE